jgi:hypothetical protein
MEFVIMFNIKSAIYSLSLISLCLSSAVMAHQTKKDDEKPAPATFRLVLRHRDAPAQQESSEQVQARVIIQSALKVYAAQHPDANVIVVQPSNINIEGPGDHVVYGGVAGDINITDSDRPTHLVMGGNTINISGDGNNVVYGSARNITITGGSRGTSIQMGGNTINTQGGKSTIYPNFKNFRFQ